MQPYPDSFETLGAVIQEVLPPWGELQSALEDALVTLPEMLSFEDDWEEEAACDLCPDEFDDADADDADEGGDGDEEARARAFLELLHSPEGSNLLQALESLGEALEVALEEDNRAAIRSGWFGKPEAQPLRVS